MKKIKEAYLTEGRKSIDFPIRKTDRLNAIITGCFFIAATVSAIIGLKLYDPLLTSTEYLIDGAANSSQIVLGAVFEMFLVISVCGTATMLYPYLKVYNARSAITYYTFRFMEAICILLGLVSVLSLLTLSHSYTTSVNADDSYYNAIGTLAKAFHDWSFILGPKFLLGINTFIYSYVFYKMQLVPKKLALLGMTGACLVFSNALLGMFGFLGSLSVVDLLLAFPVAIYEMILAVWLIAKGFNIQYERHKVFS